MVVFLLLLLSSCIQHIDSCIPTSPSPMPIPCRLCALELIEVKATLSTDDIAIVNGCAARTATCSGSTAEGRYIKWNDDEIINEDGTGTATLVATCNAEGTQWTYQGMPVTAMGCYAGCAQCSQNLIMIFGNSQAFATGTSVVNGCAVHTATCSGTTAQGHFIKLNGDKIIKEDGTGAATLVATCNAAGTGWTYQGMPVTEMGCYSGCVQCSPNFIMKYADSEPFTTETDSVVNGCGTRTVTCSGTPDQGRFIKWNGKIINADGAGTATLVATCNAAGTGWTFQGMPVTEIGCYTGCKQCLPDLINLPVEPKYNQQPWAGDTTVIVNGCSVRTLTCTNPAMFNSFWYMTTSQINWAGGRIHNPASQWTQTITVTCNAAGTEWTYQGTAVVYLWCQFTYVIDCTVPAATRPPCP